MVYAFRGGPFNGLSIFLDNPSQDTDPIYVAGKLKPPFEALILPSPVDKDKLDEYDAVAEYEKSKVDKSYQFKEWLFR